MPRNQKCALLVFIYVFAKHPFSSNASSGRINAFVSIYVSHFIFRISHLFIAIRKCDYFCTFYAND